MALPGAKPKADRSQVRHRVPVAEWTEVDEVPFAGGPDLPTRNTQVSWADAGVGGVDGWPELTREWWAVVRSMPHAATWKESDWQFATMTAEIHARTMEGWRGYTGTELRNREKLLGVYADARRDLRIRYVEPKPKPDDLPAGVTSLDDFRAL